MMRIKKNDTVLILTGKDKGKRGIVLDIKTDKNLVKVQGVAVMTKHAKARRQGETSAIKKVEAYVNLSNVMLVSPGDSQPCRVNFVVGTDGKKNRVCNRTKNNV